MSSKRIPNQQETQPHYSDEELVALNAYWNSFLEERRSKLNLGDRQAHYGFAGTTLESLVMDWSERLNTGRKMFRHKELDALEANDWWKSETTFQSLPSIVPKVEGVESRLRSAFSFRIASHIAWAVEDNHAEFFERIAVILRARRDKRPVKELKAKDLMMKRRAGRADTPSALQYCFPEALSLLLVSRLHDLGFGVVRAKITRRELLQEVLHAQQCAGLESAVTISESELSRWIGKFKFQTFMAEQPVARNQRPVLTLREQVAARISAAGLDWFQVSRVIMEGGLFPEDAPLSELPDDVLVAILAAWGEIEALSRVVKAEKPIARKPREKR